MTDEELDALVKRGGEWLVIGDDAYKLRDLSVAAFNLVKEAGSTNPGFDMPGWFFTGSPYAKQIIALGCEAHPIPADFMPEVVPNLGSVWRSRRPIWDSYIAGDRTALQSAIRAAKVEAWREAADELKGQGYNTAVRQILALIEREATHD